MMSCPPRHSPAAVLDRVDPRARILAAVALAAAVACASRMPAIGLALAVAEAAAAMSGLGFRAALRRLLPLNLFMLLLLIILPLTTDGEPVATLGPWSLSREGLLLAGTIALKANAIVLALVALIGTIELTALGHALHHLYVPLKLTHLLLFTVRYIAVLQREYRRLAAAAKIRGFIPGVNRHTYRTYGHLVGMLLVRSLDRSERIVAAMKCRGFRGHFYLLDHFAMSRADAVFAAAGLAILVLLGMAEWA